jgi:LysM repeat protein
MPEIQRSSEKALIGGKAYYIHIAKKKQTLYSIAKAYNVTVDDILQVNPGMTTDVKVDQSIRIPEELVKKGDAAKPKSEGKLLHVVSTGQTLYSISRIYGITVDDLEKTNPEVKIDSLQINQVLIIPQVSKTDTPKDQSQPAYIIHKVAEKETLYSLAKMYGVSQDSILTFNGLTKADLKTGQELKIPSANKTQNTVKIDTATTEKSNIKVAEINCDTVVSMIKENKITISLLLPFSSSSVDAESDGEVKNESLFKQEEIKPRVQNFIEFYQGILVALDNFKHAGIQIDLNVYDSESSTSKVSEILKKPELKKSNFIIGPAYNDQMKLVAEYGRKNEIYVISPVSHFEGALKGNPYFIQINPGKVREEEACINLLQKDTSKRFFAVYNRDTANIYAFTDFKKILREREKRDSINVKEITVFDNDFSYLKSCIDSLHENVVISPVTDEIFVSPLLGILESKLIFSKISAIGSAEWINYSNIDLNYFFDLQLTYGSAFYFNYQSENVISFIKKYRLLFDTDPVSISKYGFSYSMLGYDIVSYFTNAYTHFGKNFTNYFPCVKYKSLTAPFNFVQTGQDDGFTNTTTQIVRYNRDYTIEVLKK